MGLGVKLGHGVAVAAAEVRLARASGEATASVGEGASFLLAVLFALDCPHDQSITEHRNRMKSLDMEFLLVVKGDLQLCRKILNLSRRKQFNII